MKKNLLLLMALAGISYLPAAAQPTIKNLNFEAQHADVSFVDIDGDGDLDILISGESGPDRKLQLFKNDGAGNYTASASPFKPVTRSTFDWDDINGDGKIDLIMSGFPAAGIFDSVYTSDGAGNFTRATSIGLPQLSPSTGFADLNNDGFLDIYVFGNKFDGKPKIFFNDKVGGFTESAQFDAFNFVDPDVTEVDFDNDGDIDLFVNAGFEDGVGSRFSKMFVNTNGVFNVMSLTGIIPKGNGSAVWGDFDSDGDLDLLLNGDGYLGSGEDNDGVYRLYRNNGGGAFAEATTFQSYRQNSTGDGGRFFDWDNDGDLDIVVTGYNSTISRQATDIYINTAGVFTPYAFNASIPGVSESSIEVGDIDNDSDLDLVVTGFSNHDFAGTGAPNANVSMVVVNPATLVNIAPTPPINLSVSGGAAGLTFTWLPGTDLTTPITALTYNLFIVNNAGKTFYYPVADTTTGRLLVPRMGNVQLNKSWKITGLPPGTYRWGVQSVDNSFRGSTFATSDFTINADGSLPVHLTSFTVVAEGSRTKISWSTASEQNNDRFEIERSTNGTNFNKLTTVKASGTTTDARQYSVYDYSPAKGMNYYRLVQYNKDGKPTNYGIKTANFKSGGVISLSVYPNPVVKDFGVRLMNYEGKSVTATLFDMTGKQIHKQVIQTATGQIDYQLNLNKKPASGNYILQLAGEGINETVQVIVK